MHREGAMIIVKVLYSSETSLFRVGLCLVLCFVVAMQPQHCSCNATPVVVAMQPTPTEEGEAEGEERLEAYMYIANYS